MVMMLVMSHDDDESWWWCCWWWWWWWWWWWCWWWVMMMTNHDDDGNEWWWMMMVIIGDDIEWWWWWRGMNDDEWWWWSLVMMVMMTVMNDDEWWWWRGCGDVHICSWWCWWWQPCLITNSLLIVAFFSKNFIQTLKVLACSRSSNRLQQQKAPSWPWWFMILRLKTCVELVKKHKLEKASPGGKRHAPQRQSRGPLLIATQRPQRTNAR